MRLKEFITEKKIGKIKKRQQKSSRGIHVYSDGERASGDYTEYRLGLAVAGANGKDPLKIDSKSWFGKKKVTFPYSEEEQEMLKQAYKAVGAKWKDINHGDLNSEELDNTNTVSPVSNWMGKK
jgi:hypothetical protein